MDYAVNLWSDSFEGWSKGTCPSARRNSLDLRCVHNGALVRKAAEFEHD
jgi:hypothetical protein